MGSLDSTAGRVLLVVNFTLDATYRNRHLLAELYAGRFDGMLFSVSSTCVPDPAYLNCAQRWIPPFRYPCTCGNPALGQHASALHVSHPRLAELAWQARGYEFLVMTEDDCILAPWLDAAAVRQRCAEMDAAMPEVYYCPRDHATWSWAQHPAGCAAVDADADGLDFTRLRTNWLAYSGRELPAEEPRPAFSAFVDFLVFRTDFLRRVAGDFVRLREVWHEIAIPTAVLHHTSRIRKADGIALWGQDRDRSLARLMEELREHEFIHPVKLSRYEPREVLAAYRTLAG
jgi:hypothetical protein